MFAMRMRLIMMIITISSNYHQTIFPLIFKSLPRNVERRRKKLFVYLTTEEFPKSQWCKTKWSLLVLGLIQDNPDDDFNVNFCNKHQQKAWNKSLKNAVKLIDDCHLTKKRSFERTKKDLLGRKNSKNLSSICRQVL